MQTENVPDLVAGNPRVVDGWLIGDKEGPRAERGDSIDPPETSHVETVDRAGVGNVDGSAVHSVEEPGGLTSAEISEHLRWSLDARDGADQQLDPCLIPDGLHACHDVVEFGESPLGGER